MAGKGDKPRQVNREVYETNYDLIFRKPKITLSEEDLKQMKDDLSSMSYSEQAKINRRCCGGHCGSCEENQ